MPREKKLQPFCCFHAPKKGTAPSRKEGEEWEPDNRENTGPCNNKPDVLEVEVAPGVVGWIVKCSKCGNQLVFPCDTERLAILQWNHIACKQTGATIPKDQAKELEAWVEAGRKADKRDKVKAANPGKNQKVNNALCL